MTMPIQKQSVTQLDLGVGSGTAQEHAPLGFVQEGAKRYAEGRGRTYDAKGLDVVQNDHQRGHAQFLAYERGMAQGTQPSTVASYKHMRRELHSQFDFMAKSEQEGGLGIRMEAVDHDPYPSANGEQGPGTGRQMADDVATNRRIKVWSTKSGGTSHAVFSDDENDKFRAVHDVFGHIATGRGVSRHGEEAAYLSHAQMFSPDARQALASETRGQNSYMNYNTRGETFPDQGNSLVGMPQWATETGPLPDAPKKTAKPQGKQGKLF
jgi:hypothetical protein